jgi:hypothetical protein
VTLKTINRNQLQNQRRRGGTRKEEGTSKIQNEPGKTQS